VFDIFGYVAMSDVLYLRCRSVILMTVDDGDVEDEAEIIGEDDEDDDPDRLHQVTEAQSVILRGVLNTLDSDVGSAELIDETQ
jgi:hypothetical protein